MHQLLRAVVLVLQAWRVAARRLAAALPFRPHVLMLVRSGKHVACNRDISEVAEDGSGSAAEAVAQARRAGVVAEVAAVAQSAVLAAAPARVVTMAGLQRREVGR